MVSNDHSFVRFDYSGLGESRGNIINLKTWIDDAYDVVTSLTHATQILVGSSMGAFVMLHIYERLSSRVGGMVAVAPSFDFPDKIKLWRDAAIVVEDSQIVKSMYGQWEVPESFFEENILESLVLCKDQFNFDCPLAVLHGLKDESIPWQKSINFVTEKIAQGNDVIVTLRPDGDHRMSTDNDIGTLLNLLQFVVSKAKL